MKDCENGEIDIILFTKLDRWFRSVADYYEVQSVLDKCHVPWRAIWEDYETETSNGIFKVNIMLSVAQAEADRTSERIKSVNQYLRDTGKHISGKPTTGYICKNSELYIDESKREGITEAFKTFLKTNKKADMVRVLHKYGIMASLQTVNRMLRNPTYHGDAYGYKCDAYITKEEWERIQFILDNRRTRQSVGSDRVYKFSGLLRCNHCGKAYVGRVRSNVSTNGTRHFYKFYQCGHSLQLLCHNKSSIAENTIERNALKILDDELNKYIAQLESKQKNDFDYQTEKIKIENRIRRIGDRYEIGEISRDEYMKKISSLKSQLNSLAPQKKKIPERLPHNWLEIYSQLDDKNKKSFWNQTVSNIIVIDKKNVKIVF